jgi:hypothetical protein
MRIAFPHFSPVCRDEIATALLRSRAKLRSWKQESTKRPGTISDTSHISSVQIDITHNVICLWCIVDFGQLETTLWVIETRPHIRWHSFELNPVMTPEQQTCGRILQKDTARRLSKAHGTEKRRKNWVVI